MQSSAVRCRGRLRFVVAWRSSSAHHLGQCFLVPPPSLGAIAFVREGGRCQVLDARSIRVGVRIVAATSRDFTREVAAGHYRLELHYRPNVMRLTTTPLGRRPEDIESLCRCFLERWSIENGPPRYWLSPTAARWLMACDWPGNVRQLQNVLERAAGGQRRAIAPLFAAAAPKKRKKPVGAATYASPQQARIRQPFVGDNRLLFAAFPSPGVGQHA